ncbi:potassium transporter TrkA [Stenomitos frigidus ULC18]|uniref:Potassium transporter TrkA n=2 Tax=Stenomitos TaxID=1844270 RepID=A0A2T1EBE3_9CYAN|nr:potassium transporter TrkA [Stenomitos frigidus ULC18]
MDMVGDRRSEKDHPSERSRFLVCGLGSLGQYCAMVLNEFGVPVSAMTTPLPTSWESPLLPALLDDLVIGDCRQPEALENVIHDCRAVLLVTSDERVNVEAAFAIRLLNPTVRLVVRSAKQNLNALLSQSLGNFVAFEATQLPAPAFAIAALASEVRGFINLGEHLLRVVKVPIGADHRWRDVRLLHELNTSTRRLLSHIPKSQSLPTEFHQWEADARVQTGDLIAYIEVTGLADLAATVTPTPRPDSRVKHLWRKRRQLLSNGYLRQTLLAFWHATAQQQTKRVAIVVGSTMLSLLVCGTVIFKLTQPGLGWLKAFYTAGVMLLGSYDTVFGILNPQDSIPLWMRLMNLSYMMAGTASIAVLYALLTETLLAAKFQLPKKRPPIPQQDHVVLIGLGRVGRRVATFLQQIKQPLVGVSNQAVDPTLLPQMPLVVNELTSTLSKVNLATAKSVVIATDDEMTNLELGLMVHAANPHCALVIRTFDTRFSASIDRLLPYAKVLCAYDLAAEAFVAAAFGENVLNLMRLNEQTVLVTEYTIAPDDHLQGQLLAEVAYGYGAVPILHQRSTQASGRLMPSDDTRLEAGDRLVILATSNSLQQIERGERLPRQWQVCIDKALSKDALFDGATTIARISGCSINTARDWMQQLPCLMPFPLYKQQAQRLVRELSKAQVLAHLVPK